MHSYSSEVNHKRKKSLLKYSCIFYSTTRCLSNKCQTKPVTTSVSSSRSCNINIMHVL